MAARRGGRRKAWPVLIGLGVVLALVSYFAVRFIRSTTPDECTAHGLDGTTVTLDLDQASHAATIAAVAHERGLPERAVTVALATAIQESKLRNLGYGDRDSLGLFQQRPSQGWGSPAQIRDPVYASGRFFDALAKVPDYLDLPVTVAAQKVQRSGYPEAYAQHEDMAVTLANVLTGHDGPALSCRVSAAMAAGATAAGTESGASGEESAPAGGNGAAGSVPQGDAGVAAAVRREFGRVPAALPATGGGNVSYPIAADQAATGWCLALWLVCHAAELHATSVTYAGRRWSSTTSDQGWTHTDSASVASSSPSSGEVSTVTVTLS
ncbi:heavy metal transporter [Streptomyces misionensis]|uniref:Heavy metal transporter n=1 Tax=Streptomyces misionensis TaxID=67331 RepID=A0A5C6IVU8_9ACTN|nr:heavy metal transporter [Streptomyces misionensis]TWV33136.1 heavy metal transporter [Streptomyces misionensis]